MSIYYSFLFLFAILGYAIAVDKNVSDAVVLLLGLLRIKIERFYWMIRFHPRNPVTNLIIKWKYEKLAQDLHKELTANESRVNMESESNLK